MLFCLNKIEGTKIKVKKQKQKNKERKRNRDVREYPSRWSQKWEDSNGGRLGIIRPPMDLFLGDPP